MNPIDIIQFIMLAILLWLHLWDVSQTQKALDILMGHINILRRRR